MSNDMKELFMAVVRPTIEFDEFVRIYERSVVEQDLFDWISDDDYPSSFRSMISLEDRGIEVFICQENSTVNNEEVSWSFGLRVSEKVAVSSCRFTSLLRVYVLKSHELSKDDVQVLATIYTKAWMLKMIQSFAA